MIDHKYWELHTLPYPAYKIVFDSWDDDQRLRYEHDKLQEVEFIYEFLTANYGRMTRALGLEERQVQYVRERIKSCEHFIAYDDQYRKSRAWAKKKEAEEQGESAKARPPLGPEQLTLGKDVKPEIILQIKCN